MCGVVKRDGKPCGSWFDKRVSDVCEYHVQHAVQRCRAGRPEFSAGSVLTFLPPKRISISELWANFFFLQDVRHGRGFKFPEAQGGL
jgi:hypothetical protein